MALVVPSDCPDCIIVAFFENYSSANMGPFDGVTSIRMRIVSPKYEHCQFMFQWSTVEGHPGLTFSTTKRTPASFVDVAYKDVKWDGVLLSPLLGAENSARRRRLFRWVLEHESVPFDNCGYYCNFVPPASCIPSMACDSEGESFFCAEMISTALRDVGMPGFATVQPCRCTPDDVFRILTRISNCGKIYVQSGTNGPGRKKDGDGAVEDGCAGMFCWWVCSCEHVSEYDRVKQREMELRATPVPMSRN